jgi:uncharacterized membrane protein YjjP (DUF1212 family)
VTGGSHDPQAGLRAPTAEPDVPVQGVLELALRLGEAMISLGAPAADATEAMLRVTRAFGLRGCQVDLTFTSITASHDHGPQGVPVTMLRVVVSRVPDYGRLQRLLELARDVSAAPIPPERVAEELDRAHSTLDRVVSAPRLYRRWVVTAALSLLAAAVAVLLGGGPAVALVAGATTTAIDRVLWLLGRWGLPPFFLQAAGAAVAALVAVLLYLALPVLPVEQAVLPPSLVVASGIVVLLAGLSLVGAAEDAISGFPLTAGARTFEVLVLTLGIVVGIGAVLDVARRAGVPLVLLEPPVNTSPLVVQVLSAAAVSLAWAVASYARPRAVLLAAGVGGVAWAVLSLGMALGAGPAVASAGAAVVVGLLGETVGARLRVPAIITSVCGIVPLLPGLAIYRGLFELVDDPMLGLLPGLRELFGAALVGLGLAAGVTLGEFLGAPLRVRARRRRSTGQVPAHPSDDA